MTHPSTVSAPLQNKVLLQAQQFVLNLYNQKHNAALVYHNYAQMSAIAENIKQLARHTKRTSKTTEVALLAAYFHTTGYLDNYDDPKSAALRITKTHLEQQQYSDLPQVLTSIESVFTNNAKSVADALFSDARNAVLYGENYSQQSSLHRLELELVRDEKYTKKEWQQRELNQLLNVKFYTPYGKIHYAPMLAQNIARQKNRVEKGRVEATPTNDIVKSPFSQLEKEATARGAQTFFRANYRNHINLSAIADNKANIMISVNSILISVLITVLTWRNITETQPEVLLPGVIFLVTALASLIFAVLSARPKVTNLNEGKVEIAKVKKNIAFFGNFVTLNLEQYEAAMDEVLIDDELLYGNMSRDLYFLGKVLSKKYYYLAISYNVFMVGFSISVALFLVLLFIF